MLAAEPLYVLVDTAIVGHIGTDALGGLAIAGTALTAITWLFGFLSMGTTTRVATAVGAGDERAAAAAVRHGAALALAIGCALLVLLELLAEPIVALLGGEDEVAAAANTYLRVGALGAPFILLSFVGHAWWRGHSMAMRSLQVVIVANVVNIVLEIVFVYSFDWGIAGSAWGTVCAQVLAATWLAIGVGRAIGPRPAQRSAWSDVRPMLVDGWQIMVRTLVHVSVLIVSSATAARLGGDSLAAHQIGWQLFAFLALSLDALAVPAQVFTGQSFGAGDHPQASSVVRRCLVLGVIVGGVLAAALIGTSGVLASVFSDDGAVTSAAVGVLVLLGLLQLPGAIAFVLDGALLGAADYKGLQRTTWLAACSFVPFVIAALTVDRFGLVTLWVGLLVNMCMRALLNTRRWQRVRSAAAIVAAPGGRHIVLG